MNKSFVWFRTSDTPEHVRVWAPSLDLAPEPDLFVCAAPASVSTADGCQTPSCAKSAPPEVREEFGALCKERSGTLLADSGELCRCCGAEVLEPHLQVPAWFCPECLKRARSVNEALGFCALPVGWHSLVNGFYIDPTRMRSRIAATAEADQFVTFFRESGDVWARGLNVVERQSGAFRAPEGYDGEFRRSTWRRSRHRRRQGIAVLGAPRRPGHRPRLAGLRRSTDHREWAEVEPAGDTRRATPSYGPTPAVGTSTPTCGSQCSGIPGLTGTGR